MTTDDSTRVKRPLARLGTPLTSIIGLIVIWTIFLVESLAWAWSILFIVWAVIGVRANETFLVGQIRRDEHPVLFWMTSATWFTMGLLWPFL